MGLTTTLSNALSGMNVTQRGLDIVSRNVANAGTPGYHRQSLSLVEATGSTSASARATGVQRAFTTSLQAQYTKEISDSAYAGVTANYLDSLQSFLGKPGKAGSLDTLVGNFHNALQGLATSPDDYASRSEVIGTAQALSGQLNGLSTSIQSLRGQAEEQISANVAGVNRDLQSLADINRRLIASGGTPDASRAALLDERDRLISQVAEAIDVKAAYRSDGSASLMTRSGMGLLDGSLSATLNFASAGQLAPTSIYSSDGNVSGVGELTISTPSGARFDLVAEDVVKGGAMGALIDLRDGKLVQAQAQLDEIASALALALATVDTSGEAASAGGRDGLEVDLGDVAPGNDFVLNYTQNGAAKSVRVVRVDDTAKLPMDFTSAGQRVVGLDFSGGIGAVATALQGMLGSGFAVSSAGDTLRVLDDGAANTISVTGLTAHTIADSAQSGALGLNLFVDGDGSDFTNSLDGAGQKRGFAARISVNPGLVADNTLLVKHGSSVSLGNAERPNFLLERLDRMGFSTNPVTSPDLGGAPLSGTISQITGQVLNFQGSSVAAAQANQQARSLTMEALDQRMASDHGVSVDEEMARLMELQNAFAANARVITVVQDLLDALMRI